MGRDARHLQDGQDSHAAPASAMPPSDRLTHRAAILEFVGTSYRFRQQLHRQEGKEGETETEEHT